MVNVAVMKGRITLFALAPLASLTACTASDAELVSAYDGIGADEVITLGGTEPFWGAEINGSELTYSTPDNIDGTLTTVERFAGNGGLSFSGELNGAALNATVTPGTCSDGMSDFSYPFTATMMLGDRLLQGCGHTDKQPVTGQESSAGEAQQ
ncbi:MAG: hypothetical protein ABJP34_05610 [Erythrobacter sp.]